MFSISHIVAPVVFSDNCRGAFRYAVSVAEHFGAHVTVLHVLEPLIMLDFDSTPSLKNLEVTRRAWATRELSDMTLGFGHKIRISETCAEGDPAREIVKFSEQAEADLIVMATHGHGPFRRFLLGSVTAKVLHDAKCAVWTGSHLETALTAVSTPDKLRQVLCAVDASVHAQAALQWSSGIASAYEAKLSILNVIAPARDATRQRVACEEAHHRLDKQRAYLQTDAECHVAIGDVSEEVSKAARQMKADLLVIGRGHLEGGGRLRSTSYELIRQSPCPVVSV